MTAGLDARRAATALVTGVLHRRAALNDMLAGPDMPVDPRERGLARMIAATTLRRHGELSAALGRLAERPLKGRSLAVREILLTGLAQILFMDVPAHAAVDLAVRQAASAPDTRAYRGLVNGVLRNAERRRATLLDGIDAVAANIPAWLFGRWERTYGADRARTIAASMLREPALDLSVKADPEDWAARLGGAVLPGGTVRIAGSGSVTALDGFDDGGWWVQDAAARVPASLLGDVTGLAVADLCAAPGGKTAQLAAAGARVVAVDRSKSRMRRLEANMARLSLDVETVIADAAAWQPATALAAILLDAPCSATGTVRRHPDLVHVKSDADIARLANVQARLLDHAATLLAPGARLVFCTCSLEPEEGENQVARLLSADAGLARSPVATAEVPGFEAAVTSDGDLRITPDLPAHPDPVLAGSTGFFISRLVRK